MLYTYILDGSIKSPTLILTADHSTLLFLAGFFTKQRTSFFFCGWTSTWSQAYICMTLPLLTAHFSWTLPFLSLKKLWPSLCFHPRSPLLNFLSQVIFVFLLFWGMVMYANDIETNGKQKLPEIKKLISFLDFLCYSIRSTMSLELLSTNNNLLYMCKCSDPEGVDFDSIYFM